MPATIAECNSNGHIVLSFTGIGLTGDQEIQQAEYTGNNVGDTAKAIFQSLGRNGYNRCHRLTDNHPYKIALIPAREIVQKSCRTTVNVQTLGRSYGYRKPRAGIVPRTLDIFSDTLLGDMGIQYIAAPNKPIYEWTLRPHLLYSRYRRGGHWIMTYWDSDSHRWDDNGVFAFPIA